VGPARATILRNVLVTHICQVIDTVDIAPVPSFGNRVNWDKRRVYSRLGNDIRLDTTSMIGGYSARDSVGSSSKEGYNCELFHMIERLCFKMNYY